jgi:predicted metal-binding membrane protein
MSTVSVAQSARSDRRAPILWPWALVALAWGLAGLAVLSGQGYLVDHHQLLDGHEMAMGGHFMRMGGLHLPWLAALAVFLASWQVMTVAMMLPSSLPMLYLMIHASRQQRRPRQALAAFLAGYAAVWSAFAVMAFLGDDLVHRLTDAWPWLGDRPWLVGAVTLAVAGAFQFSALKERCLTQCRTPFGFFVHYYRRGPGGAWRLGVRHGVFCLGCCWALMLIMFGVGVGALTVMGLLAGVMLIEKAIPGGHRLSPAIGVALLLLAMLWVVHPAGLPV